MSKQIIIIGGGISGLAVLHNLKKKYKERDDIHICLIEKNEYPGGTARTEVDGNRYFEYGPNGFLSSAESTFQLVKDLGLEERLMRASPESRTRYISVRNKLYRLPSNPLGIFSFKPLSLYDKIRILAEPFIPKGSFDEESVYGFGKRRFGEGAAKYFLDPMVSGVFGGDAKAVNLKCAFPRIFEMEQRGGSLIKGFLFKRRKKGNKRGGFGRLMSFKKGMSELSNKIYTLYKEDVHLNEWVQSVSRAGDGFSVETDKVKYFADELFICAPAYAAAKIIASLNPELSQFLGQINYAPIAVIGLVCKRDSLREVPKGFGYLIPSAEEKQVLGVLFASNIFPNRTPKDEFMFRIMIGGARSSDIMHKSQDELIEMGKEELAAVFAGPIAFEKAFFVAWEKAIPQYDVDYLKVKYRIEDECEKMPNLYIVANYLGGVSLNDCTRSAEKAAEKSLVGG